MRVNLVEEEKSNASFNNNLKEINFKVWQKNQERLKRKVEKNIELHNRPKASEQTIQASDDVDFEGNSHRRLQKNDSHPSNLESMFEKSITIIDANLL